MSLKGNAYTLPDPTMSVDPTILKLDNAIVPTTPMMMGTHVADASGVFILKGNWKLAASTEVRFIVTHATQFATTTSNVYNGGVDYLILDVMKAVNAGDTITISRAGTAANTILNGTVAFYFVKS
jgi:hypothetical protein